MADKPRTDILPLVSSYREPSEFPLDCLGQILSEVGNRLAEVIGAPRSLCGQSVLAGVFLGVQGHRNVVVDSLDVPISNNFITVAVSGERKTAVDNFVLRPHRLHEIRLREQYCKDLQRYVDRRDIYKKKRENLINKTKDLMGAEGKLRELGEEPVKPLEPILIVEEPTFEGLVKLLHTGQPSVGMFTDEGGRLIGGIGMSQEHVLKTVSGLSCLWDGKRMSRIRSGDGNSVLSGKRVSMHLMIQPLILEQLLSNFVITGQGWLARSLITFPESNIGSRKYKAVDLNSDSALVEYNERIRCLLTAGYRIKEGTRNVIDPLPLAIEGDAKSVWVDFSNDVESQLSRHGRLHEIQALGCKAAEHALRIAGALTLFQDLDAENINIETMKNAIVLTWFYLDEAARITEASALEPELVKARELKEWIYEKGESPIYTQRLLQFGPSFLRKRKALKPLTNLLVEYGYLRKLGGMEVDGAFRREVWEVVELNGDGRNRE